MDEDLSSTPKQESLISGNSCTHTYGAQSQKRKHGNRPESFTPYSSQNSTLGIDSKKSNQHFNDFESVDMNMLKTNAMACLVSSSDVDYLHNLENTPRCLNVEGIIHDDTRHQKDANINPIIRDSILSNFQCDNVISERDIKSINMVFDNQSTDIFTEQVIGQSNFSKTIDNSDPNQNALVEGISNNKSIFSDKAYNEIKQENSQACSLSYQNQVASVNITETYPFETIHRKLDTISYNGRLSNRMKNIEIQLSPVRIRIAATLGEDSVEHVDQSMEIEVDSDNNDPEDPVTDEQEANDIEEDNNESIGHAASTGEAIVSSVENTVSAEVNEPLAKVEIAATFSETSTSFSNETKNTSGDELKLAFVDEILTENEEKTLSSEFKDIIHHEDQQVSDIVSYTAGLDKEERRTEVGDQDIDEGVDVSDMDDLENLGEMKVDAEVVAESENGNNKKESKEKMFETSKQSSSDIGNEGIATIQKNEIDENENGCEIEDDDSNSLNEEETYMKENDNVVDEDIKDKHEECSDEKQDGNIETDAKEEREKNVETDIDKGKNEDIIRDTLEKEKTSEKNDSNNSPKNQVDGGETHEDSEVEKKNVTEAKSTQELEEQTASNHEGNIQAVCTKDDPDITERKASKEDIGDEITENIEKNQDTVTEEKDKSNNDSDDSEDVINENTDNSAFNSEKNTELGSVPVQESSQEDILELQMESGTTQNLENNDDQTKFAIKEPTALSTDEINAMENSDQVSQEELKNLDEVQLKETEYINEELNEDNQDTHISDAANQLNAELVDEHDAEDEANNGDEVADSNIKILSPKTKETEVSQALQNTLQQETENKDKESKTYIAGEEANKEEEQGSSEQGENGDFDHEKMNSKDFKEFSKTSDIESNNTVDDSLDIVERKETYDDIIEETVDTVDENVTEDSTASLLENIHHNYSSDRERNDDITEETCPKDTEASENCPEEETNAMCAERADQEQQEKTSDAAENECVLLVSEDHDVGTAPTKEESEATVTRTQESSETKMFGDVQNDEKEQVSEEQDDFESMSIEELNEKLKDAVETSVDEEEVNLEAPDELNSETVEEEQNLAAVDKLNPEAADEKPITEAVEEELNPEAVKEKLNPDATEEELNPETFTEELDPEAADEQRLKAIAELSPSTIDKDKNSEAVDEEEIKLEAVDEEEITLHAAEDDKKIIQVPEENETDLDQVIDSEFKANEELISETAEQNEQQYADAEVESIECQGDSEKEDRETEAEKKDQNEILGSSDEVFKTENDNKVSEKPLQKTIVPELINLPIKPDLDVVEKSVVLEEKSSQQVICDSSKVISPRKGIKVEEDEIETAISTVQFYDESSDANEGEFVSSKISDSEQKPVALKDTGVVKSEDDENIDNEPTKKDKEEVDVGVIKKEIPLKLHSEVDGTEEKAASDATKTPTVSPKKRKRKRKVTRSRSAPQKSLHQDGVSSAAKKTQESKTAGSKGSQPEKTARSLSSGASRSASAVEKKIPPIKAPVGNAPPPKIKAARSKIGSLDNVTHKPKGGEKKVESQKLEWNAKSKVGSLDYATHKPGGGDKKILTQKVDFKNVQSKVGSKDNLKHKPGGGVVKVATEKLDFKEKAKPKVGSLDNAKHKAGGGNVSIKSEKLNFKDKASAKIHSRSESGSETQSPVQPSSPAPPESMPPLCEDDSPCSQEDQKQTNVTCNGGTGDKGAAISHEASPAISPDKVETEGKRDESNLQGNETVNGTGTQPDC